MYRDGSREGQILNKITREEVVTYLKENGKNITNKLSEQDVKCSKGTCEI